MEEQKHKVYEEPEIVDAGRPPTNDTTTKISDTRLLRKLIITSLVSLGVFLLFVGLIVWLLFWILFAILPDVVVYVLLAFVLGVVLFNVSVLGAKIFGLYSRYKIGKAQFESFRGNTFK